MVAMFDKKLAGKLVNFPLLVRTGYCIILYRLTISYLSYRRMGGNCANLPQVQPGGDLFAPRESSVEHSVR